MIPVSEEWRDYTVLILLELLPVIKNPGPHRPGSYTSTSLIVKLQCSPSTAFMYQCPCISLGGCSSSLSHSSILPHSKFTFWSRLSSHDHSPFCSPSLGPPEFLFSIQNAEDPKILRSVRYRTAGWLATQLSCGFMGPALKNPKGQECCVQLPR